MSNNKEFKSIKISIHVTESDYEKLVRLAKKSNNSISEFSRQKIFKGKVVDYEYLRKTLVAINRIGNNINQAVRDMHTFNSLMIGIMIF